MRRNIIDVLGGNINNLAVIEACKKQDYQRLSFLLSFRVERQLSPNYHDKEGKTALIYSCAKGDVRSAKLLLAHGANIHLKDEEGVIGRSACSYAFNSGNNEIIELFLDKILTKYVNRKSTDSIIDISSSRDSSISSDIYIAR